MARKDTLAAGGRFAQFSVGSSDVNDPVELKNVAPEGSREEFTPEPTTTNAPLKRFIPLEGTLLVRRIEAVNPSGILITETMEKEKPSEGIVLAAGPNTKIAEHSHIVFGKYAGAEFKLNGELLLLMDVSDVKGYIVDAQPEVTGSFGPFSLDPVNS